MSSFYHCAQAAASAAGLRLKRLDKKLERQLVHAHCKALAEQLDASSDPAASLSTAVPLLAAPYTAGTSRSVSAVDVTRPPITTIASGR